MSRERHILITAPCHPLLIDGLSSFKVVYKPDISKSELIDRIELVTGLIISTRIPIESHLIAKAKQLKWIARLGSGVDHIDKTAIQAKGIQLITSPEGNAPSLAEHTLGLLLSALRNIHSSYIQVKNNIWDRIINRGTLLTSYKIGIIGYGHMGSAFAKKLTQLGCNVYIYDKYKNITSNNNLRASSLKFIQKECNIISLHIDFQSGNYHFIDASFLSKLKQKPILINTSRGACLNTQAVIESLDKNEIHYACLDVLENEHINQLNQQEQKIWNSLINHPRVLITPHLAGVTEESFVETSKIILRKIKQLSSDKKI